LGSEVGAFFLGILYGL